VNEQATPPGGLLQADYGGFNPRFLGVSIFYDSPESYNAAVQYMTEATPASLGGLHEIALRSVGDHEGRHYIDFLLSPYSTAIFRLRLQALVNGVHALSYIEDLPGTVLPVPLTRWSLSDESARAASEAEWQEILGGPAAPIPLPQLTDEQLQAAPEAGVRSIADNAPADKFASFAEFAAGGYIGIDELTLGYMPSDSLSHLRPAYLHEASALTAQIAAIHHGQGRSQTEEFIAYLLQSDLPQALAWRDVLRVATELERLWSGEGSPLAAARRILTVTVWSMLGNFHEEVRRACPAWRFRALAAVLEAEDPSRSWSGDIDDTESLERMWDFWDQRLEVVSWRKTLTQQFDWGQRSLDQYGALAAADESEVAQLALKAVEFTVRDREKVIAAMLEDPRQLAIPETYVQAPMAVLPIPDVRLEFRGFGVPMDRVSEGSVTFTLTSPEGEEFASGVVLPAHREDTSRQGELSDKLRIENLIEWCDLVFSRLSVPTRTVRSARNGLEELTGKRVLQLI
jgi:hypothetical protein